MAGDAEPSPRPRPADTPSLAVLADRARAGEADAATQLHDRLAPAWRSLLRDRGIPESDRDDLLQRAWLGLWRALLEGRYDPARAALSTYAYAIFLNVCRDAQRARARDATSQAPADHDSNTTQTRVAEDPLGDALTRAHDLDALRRALAGPPEGLPEADAWLLRHVAQGTSDRALADRLGIAPSTLNVRKRDALARLSRWIARHAAPEPPQSQA